MWTRTSSTRIVAVVPASPTGDQSRLHVAITPAGGSRAAHQYTVRSSTRIAATTPHHSAGTVNVRVTTRGGTSPVVTADRFRYR